jgi:hypothetical protein
MLAFLQRLLLLLAPTPQRAVRLFAAANIGFLGVDIAIAHLANEFERRIEWAPIIFSALATPLLLPGALGSTRAVFRQLDRVVAFGAIAVGVSGMVLHLDSAFFEQMTLHGLVYSAPFVAPVSYVGVGLLVLLVHSEDATTPAFGAWVLFLALGGFVGNLALSLLDHAQNGFFRSSEWIAVAAAAYGVAFLAVALVGAPAQMTSELRRACTFVMAMEIVIGLAGAALHLEANLRRSVMTTTRDRFVFGAPAFAPLLFANLALLALIGLWAIRPQLASPSAPPSQPPHSHRARRRSSRTRSVLRTSAY